MCSFSESLVRDRLTTKIGIADYSVYFAPLAPQVCGEPMLGSPPELADLGGIPAS
jgi:hypothetical protein